MSNEYDGEEFSLFLQTSIRDLFSLHFEKVRAKVASVRLIGNSPATFQNYLWIFQCGVAIEVTFRSVGEPGHVVIRF